jgi:hypothetical protein
MHETLENGDLSDGQMPGADCAACRYNKANGGMDCEIEPEDNSKPCDAFSPIKPGEDL